MRLLTRPGLPLARPFLNRCFSSRRRPPPPPPTANSRPTPNHTSTPPPIQQPKPQSTVPVGTGRRTPQARPLVYSCAIFLIIGCGAITGAIFRNDHQVEAERARQEAGGEIDYQKHIDELQTKRAYLVGEQMQLERKIAGLREKKRAVDDGGEGVGVGNSVVQQQGGVER
ncbi:hypothetical protein PV10_07140 [Exophiala mesophila]|uniref:Uncharacterized protein n=1 Tax=Exophiala mesophila TaxID=212818 RepID=A0A0D1WL84_EXOME|nr:uncharacterized protein PV10_07140 [Exophiala mesophila]KIV89760.1 hypothetical protein PV10_07140 [Exophiala mesophila]